MLVESSQQMSDTLLKAGPDHSHAPHAHNLREDGFTVLFLLVWNLKPSEAAGEKKPTNIMFLHYATRANPI